MFISINLDPTIVNYLDSVCGGQDGRAYYIQNLIVADSQNQLHYIVPTQVDP